MKFTDFTLRSSMMLGFVASLISCKSTTTAITQPSSYPTELLIRQANTMPTQISDSVYVNLSQQAMVFKFYKQFGNELAWHDIHGITLLADTLMSFIANARYYGLASQHYHYDEIRRNDSTSQNTSHDVRKDALLTDAFIKLAHDLRHGQLKPYVLYGDSMYVPLLLRVLNQGHLTARLESQEPEFIQYKSLKKALGLILDTVSADNPEPILPGQGLQPAPSDQRIRLIALNLERWRGETTPFSDKYLLVNIPAFSLLVMDSNKVVFESKIIVGKPGKATPLLSSVIECVSIYPYWHVPRKISVEEYLPIIQKDTSFLRRNNFEVLDRKGKILRADTLQWSRFSKNKFPVSLRQREGEENSLGVIKFVFDNPYAVYLHDTNNKRLFRSEKRAFSHGCVRVEKALALSHYLVTGNLEQRSKVVMKYLNEKRAHQVNLLNPIPIYIRYFTCDFRDNILYEYRDVYGMDSELKRSLDQHNAEFLPLQNNFKKKQSQADHLNNQ